MAILLLSLNHRVTPLEVRESIVFGKEEGQGFVDRVRERGQASEAMLLSTCNRTEVYLVHDSLRVHEPERDILALLAETRGFVPNDSKPNYMVLREAEAVRHIFRVAGGLESQILGESQILAQVKRAIASAQEAGTVGRVLFRLSERALRVGKRIRTETALGDGALSASYAALELARKIFGTLERKRVLVIGAGEIAVLTLQNLQGIHLGGLTILNRSREHAMELAARFGGKVRDFSELSTALGEADLVISSTSSREPIVGYREMKKIRYQRGGNQPLLIVDLALPRDFDERCGTLDEVFLKNLDDLKEIVSGNIAEREKELPRAEAIVEKELGTFFRWLESLEVEPTIRRLRERFHGMREDELRACKSSVDPETYARIEKLTRRLVNRLLHLPITNLRRHAALREQGLSALIHEILTEEIPYSEGQPEVGSDGDLDGEGEASAADARDPTTPGARTDPTDPEPPGAPPV